MPQTTLEIEASILEELKRLQAREGRSLDEIVSRLLASALSHQEPAFQPLRLEWRARPMRALVDLADNQAVQSAMDERDP